MTQPLTPINPSPSNSERLILASSSKYRRELLERLRLPFICHAPDIDEAPYAGETPLQTCTRLARQKAQAVQATVSRNQQHLAAIIIGSDQVAVVNGQAISKPGTHANAKEQLTAMSGQTICFHSAVCVIKPSDRQQDKQCDHQMIEFDVPTYVTFRTLSADEIESYLLAETPYDCAGSAKSEGLGITLLNKIESTDPTALIGLPLIELARALRQLGIQLP